MPITAYSPVFDALAELHSSCTGNQSQEALPEEILRGFPPFLATLDDLDVLLSFAAAGQSA